MILEWMLAATATSGLVGGAALCAERGIAAAGIIARVRRRAIWLVAILASVGATIIAPASILPAHRAPAVVADFAQTTAVATAPEHLSRVDGTLLLFWAIASICCLLLLLLAQRRLARVTRECRTASVAGRNVLVSSNFGPATIGVFDSRIVIPAWVLELGEAEQTLIVSHEYEHSAAHDPTIALAGLAAAVITPWNVALWWQLARLRTAIEVDCDSRVVGPSRPQAIAYGGMLVRVGERVRELRGPALAFSRSKSSLGTRVEALLARDTKRPAYASGTLLVALGLVSAVGFIPSRDARSLILELRPAGNAHYSIDLSDAKPLGNVAPSDKSSFIFTADSATHRANFATRAAMASSGATKTANEIARLAVPSVAAVNSSPALDVNAVRSTLKAEPMPQIQARFAGAVIRAAGTSEPPRPRAIPNNGTPLIGGVGGFVGRGGAAFARPAPADSGRARIRPDSTR